MGDGLASDEPQLQFAALFTVHSLDSLFANWARLGSREARFSISPHLNHRHLEAHEACCILWFEQWLKGRFAFPRTPELAVKLDAIKRYAEDMIAKFR